MKLSDLKQLYYKPLQQQYKEFLCKQGLSKVTVETAYSDAFYLWRKGSRDLFWDIVESDNFEEEATKALKQLLIENTSGKAEVLYHSYLSPLRRFRNFVYQDELTIENQLDESKNKNITTSGCTEERVIVKATFQKGANDTGCRKLQKTSGKEIIINKMYTGAYLSEGDNIGHEIINLYRADDEENYIFLNSQGTIDPSHAANEITILLVRKSGTNTYKVLAKAEGITIIEAADSRLPQEERYRKQCEMELAYGGVKLVDLFQRNLFHGNQQEEKNTCTTFHAERVIKPVGEIYITDVELNQKDLHEPVASSHQKNHMSIFYIRTKNGFGKQTLREYFQEYVKPDSYEDLASVVNNRALWEETNTTQSVLHLTESADDQHFNFLKIIGQEDHELAFSNMFAHFFISNRNAFCQFTKQILKIDLQPDYKIEREKNNIDLLISDENNVIIIENKIKSDINGVDKRHNIYSSLIQSQLKKYYQYVTECPEYQNKTVHCFIFSPNYNQIDLSKFSCGEKFNIINYKTIYQFFMDNAGMYLEVRYFSDFVNALYKHTKEYDNDLEEEMQRRLQNAIRNRKKDNRNDD